MAIPSLIFLFVQCPSLVTILAWSRAMLWLNCLTWTASALLWSPFFTAHLCSFMRSVSVLPFSPMYSATLAWYWVHYTFMILAAHGGLYLHKTASESPVCCENCSDVDVLDLLLYILTESLDIVCLGSFHLPHHLAGLTSWTFFGDSTGLVQEGSCWPRKLPVNGSLWCSPCIPSQLCHIGRIWCPFLYRGDGMNQNVDTCWCGFLSVNWSFSSSSPFFTAHTHISRAIFTWLYGSTLHCQCSWGRSKGWNILLLCYVYLFIKDNSATNLCKKSGNRHNWP